MRERITATHGPVLSSTACADHRAIRGAGAGMRVSFTFTSLVASRSTTISSVDAWRSKIGPFGSVTTA